MIRIFVAAVLATGVSLFVTKLLIEWLSRLKIGQPIHEDVKSHTTKDSIVSKTYVSKSAHSHLQFISRSKPLFPVFFTFHLQNQVFPNPHSQPLYILQYSRLDLIFLQ